MKPHGIKKMSKRKRTKIKPLEKNSLRKTVNEMKSVLSGQYTVNCVAVFITILLNVAESKPLLSYIDSHHHHRHSHASQKIANCRIVGASVSFLTFILPFGVVALVKYVNRLLKRPMMTGYEQIHSGYEEFANLQHSHEDFRLVRFDSSSTGYTHVLVFVPSFLCAIAFGLGSNFLCKYLATK